MENFDFDAFVEESKKYKACAGIWIDKENDRIELLLDTSAATYNEWIPGEGADISLLRCHKSRKVIGVNLPLYQTDFSIFHTDGIRVKINEGYLNNEEEKEIVQSGYDRAKELAKEIWFDENETEDASGRYYFTCGFAAGMKYQRQQALDKLNELDQEMGLE